jgi:hypothetical protein
MTPFIFKVHSLALRERFFKLSSYYPLFKKLNFQSFAVFSYFKIYNNRVPCLFQAVIRIPWRNTMYKICVKEEERLIKKYI